MSDIHNFDPDVRLRPEQGGGEDEMLRAAGDAPGRSGYPGYPDAPSEGGGPHLLDYVRVLYKRRWSIIAAFTAVMLTVIVYTFTATPVYQATTKLLIESDSPNVVSFKEVINEEQAKADYYQTQYNILQSRTLARRTLESLHLWGQPEFASSGKPGMLASVAGGVMSLLGKAPKDIPTPEATETTAQSKAIDTFLRKLTISPVRNSRIVDVKFESVNPQVSSTVVNALAQGYIDQNLEFKFMSSKEASDWLGQRLGEERKQVEAAETKLQQYREQNDAISMKDRENITVQKLSDLNAAVTRAKTERIQKEAMYQQLQASQSDPTRLDTFPAILANTFIQQQKGELADLQRQQAQLSEKLGDKHPDIVKINSAIQVSQTKLNGEIAKVVQSVRSEYLSALAQENSLTAALNQQKTEALSMNRKNIDYSVLERDVDSSKQIYESLMQRAKETGVSSELKTSNIRVVDRAETPRRPSSPDYALNLLLGLLGGGTFGVGLAFFFEYLDSHIKTPDEIVTHLHMPALGMLPAVNAKEFEGYPLLDHHISAGFSEAFRAVRTNIIFSSAEEGSRTLVVTSTGPGEGKTTFSANLAISLAQTGQRVLLIDGDMRKPKLQEAFGVAQEPGLSNLLVGKTKASECVRKTRTPGLWVLPAGKIPPNPAELLGSQRFREFLIGLKEHFDWVLLDSPPVMAVIDAAVVAHRATGVVFVVGAEMTSRHNAMAAVKQLENAHAKFVGAVLNKVEIEKHHYYYSQYYKKSYGQYYAKSGTA